MSREKLTAKREAFCRDFTCIGSLTFGNGTRSAIAAGYAESSAAVMACNLLKDQRIIARINQLHSENMVRNMITVDKVLSDLEHDKLMARENHQYAVAKACTELQGRYLAMFTDKSQVEDVTETRRMSEKEEEEAKRIAHVLLRKVG
jgi:phage terminase small subunit